MTARCSRSGYYDGLIFLKDILEKYIKDLQDSGKLKTVSVQFDFDPVNGF